MKLSAAALACVLLLAVAPDGITASSGTLRTAFNAKLRQRLRAEVSQQQLRPNGGSRRRSPAAAAGSTASSSGVSALPLTVEECTIDGGCVASTKYIVADQNWRWYYHASDYTNCFSDGAYTCSSASGCADCVLGDMADATGGYEELGISTSQDSLHLKYAAPSGGTGSRVYLMDGDDATDEYTMLQLLGKEIAFDVDSSTLDCGFNGAAYLVEMAADGSKSTGAQGAIYGTGYCDAQCPGDLHTTVAGATNYANSNICCNEMDLWEANGHAYATTPHPCADAAGGDIVGPTTCTGDACTNGVCDSAGCDFNPYRNGMPDFYGTSQETVNSSETITVVTQFLGDEATGALTEIRKLFVVNDVVIDQTNTTVNGQVYDSITTEYCADENAAFGGGDTFPALGGLARMGGAMQRGMVMVFSVWNDPSSHMLWLDGTTGSGPGDVRGPCGQNDYSEDTSVAADASVTFSNLKWGEIGSTYTNSGKTAAPTMAPPSTPAPTASSCLTDEGAQCAYGGMSAPVCCAASMVCCDNGAASEQWASCQTAAYCNSDQCEIDGGRTAPCAIVSV